MDSSNSEIIELENVGGDDHDVEVGSSMPPTPPRRGLTWFSMDSLKVSSFPSRLLEMVLMMIQKSQTIESTGSSSTRSVSSHWSISWFVRCMSSDEALII